MMPTFTVNRWPSTEEHKNLLISVAKSASDNAAKQYDDYYKSFAALDGKAQNTCTIGGIVLASVIAFFTKGHTTSLPCEWCLLDYILLLLPPTAALTAAMLSLEAFWVRDVVIPFSAIEEIEEVDLLIQLPDAQFSQQHVIAYYHNRLKHWTDAIESINQVVEKKARFVIRGQIALAVSLAFLLLLFIRIVFHP